MQGTGGQDCLSPAWVKTEKMNPEIMHLEFVSELPGCLVYKISVPGASTQNVLFYNADCSIEFTKPFSENFEYLYQNKRWLRSILSTASKAEKKENFRIPFTFPVERCSNPDPDNALIAYCDGSCHENGTGGWASVVLTPDGKTIELSGNEKNSTSNRMELMAAFKAIEKAAGMLDAYGKKSILLFTDSTYVIKGIRRRFRIWSINGFITAKGTPVTNTDLCLKIYEITKQTNVCCEWVKSGSGDIYHNRCDMLAGEASGTAAERHSN